MKKISMMFVSAAIIGSLAVALPVFAKPGEGHRDCGGATAMGPGMHGDPEARIKRMTQELGLSSTQHDAVRAIIAKNRPSLRELRERLAGNHKQLRALTAQGDADAAQVRQLADAQGRAMADMIVLHTQMQMAIDKVLTPEQREKMHKRPESHGMHDD